MTGAAEMLAVSRRTIYRMIKAGELHPFRVGARLRLEQDDLRAYVERQREGG